jgi:hypothetical protein
MKNLAKRLTVIALALALVLCFGLVGCTDSGGNKADNSGNAATNSAGSTNGTSSTNNANNTNNTNNTGTTASTTIAEEWEGTWYSKSEILPPEQETDQYSLEVAADGSFSLKDGDAELYKGSIEVTDQPEPGWGEAKVSGKTIKVQLVNAQGVYKLIFNAGDDWNKDLKKIVFMR